MSSEQPLHVVIKIPYKRPPGFVEPPSVVWTEEMEQKLWEILTQNKRQSIDWYAASRLLNVPVPYLLRHAAFLYETQLRGVQMQLRRGEALSASNSTGTIGNRNRASSRASLTKVSIFDGDGVVTGHQRPPSATSNTSREQYTTSRGGYAGSQDMIRTGSNTSLTDGRKQASGSASSSIHAPVAHLLNEAGLQVQGKNVLAQTQATPSSGRQMSPSSSVSTITTDQVTKQSTHLAYKQNNYSTALSTIESSITNESFATPAASVTMPLSRTLSNSLSPETRDLSKSIQNMKLDDDSDEDDDSLKKSEDSSSERLERLEKLQKQDIAAFLLPNSSSSGIQTDVIDADSPLENNESISFKVPMIDLAVNLQQPTKGLKMNIPTASADSQQSLSANDSSSSFSDIDSLTHSELENAYLDEASNFNGSKTSLYSARKTG